jgi:hypothetical protein
MPFGSDPLITLASALDSEYVAAGELRQLPVWHQLSEEARCVLAKAAATKESGIMSAHALWVLRRSRRTANASDFRRMAGMQGRAFGHLLLGFQYLAYQKGRLSLSQLLRRAAEVADHLVCGVDFRPFVRAERELKALAQGESPPAELQARVEILFQPYVGLAIRSAKKIGLESEKGARSTQ